MTTLFVDVILPLHLPGTYTYRVPQDYNEVICVGQRVAVQFGNRRLYSALVRRVHEEVPQYRTKYVLSVLDEKPFVSETIFQFWEWIASYYMCYVGDVSAIAMPSVMRLASESAVALHPEFDGNMVDLSETQQRVVQLLVEHPVMKLSDLSVAIGIQKIMPIIQGLIERHIVMMDEELRQRYSPKTSIWLHLSPEYSEEESCRQLLDSMEQKSTTQKQVAALLLFLQLSHFGQDAICKKTLVERLNKRTSSVETLIRNGILVEEEREDSRMATIEATADADSIVLNEQQQTAYAVLSQKEGPAVRLLHGVTSSGKTEVYIKLIAEQLKQGKQVLFLLPEIALTAQLINRLCRYFGKKVGVYHSRFSASQRAEVWQRTATPDTELRYQILLGARSAIFLPFVDLGLVIVDEEHDPSYKQYDPAPRYHGRDAAIYLAHLFGANAVLGSATPSLESYFNAQQGKYALATITQRYGNLALPTVHCVDMKAAHHSKEVSGHFSNFLLKHIEEALKKGEQVILFQNRRGFSLRIECDDCHWVPQCVNCDVSLVYHKSTNSLRCHYCGYSIPVPQECPSCQSTHLTMKGFGTERIEDDLSIVFPTARVARMDLDSTQQRNRYLEIINDFEERRIDILVGTQMVTKGLDFDNVSVVGILSADNLISYPDFRSFERSFQQMTQVSGRAGRHGDKGEVVIQTYNPQHQVMHNVIATDYLSMYNFQIKERHYFRYPPYYKIVDITLKCRDAEKLNEVAAHYATTLRQVFGTRVVGPEYPSVSRIRGLFLKKIMIRFERSEPIAKAKEIMLKTAEKLLGEKGNSTIMIHFDVDPQ